MNEEVVALAVSRCVEEEARPGRVEKMNIEGAVYDSMVTSARAQVRLLLHRSWSNKLNPEQGF